MNPIIDAARLIGNELERTYPAVDNPDVGAPAIPAEAVEDITETLQLVIAEVIQAWIDAGSEREVTLECEPLYLALRNHLYGWSTAVTDDNPDGLPNADKSEGGE